MDKQQNIEARPGDAERPQESGAASPGRGGRMSRQRKAAAVLRLLRGEDLETVSRSLGVTAATLSGWRDAFLAAGDLQLAGQGPHPADMVGMLVGDKDAGEILGAPANGGQPLADLAQAKAGIDQQTRFSCFQVGTIAGGTAPEYGQTNRHGKR